MLYNETLNVIVMMKNLKKKIFCSIILIDEANLKYGRKLLSMKLYHQP